MRGLVAGGAERFLAVGQKMRGIEEVENLSVDMQSLAAVPRVGFEGTGRTYR